MTHEEAARQLHHWYLEAVEDLDPEFYNGDAEKDYDYLSEQQKSIDRYIAKKVLELAASSEKKGRENNNYCAGWNQGWNSAIEAGINKVRAVTCHGSCKEMCEKAIKALKKE